MKYFLVCGLCLCLGISSIGKADAVADDTETLQILAKAASIDDYGRYGDFLTALGFSYSNLRSSAITQPGAEPALVLGKRLDMEVATTNETPLARGTSKVEYSRFLPVQTEIASVIFVAELDTNAICISDDHFAATFAPVRTVLVGDRLSPYLEREFSGTIHRSIAADFSAGCAKKIIFTQTP